MANGKTDSSSPPSIPTFQPEGPDNQANSDKNWFHYTRNNGDEAAGFPSPQSPFEKGNGRVEKRAVMPALPVATPVKRSNN
ncbi:hypothetical protein X797_005050 [Metarhizium robertsii]|uniref:Uncharacterized protein n=1 Tax=Metarhizium robertsii TaxID=568076 RepID=A0A0A1UV25_9HYPO|nr:hypothetical protein X797_005050 [Metarhizium robertsii]